MRCKMGRMLLILCAPAESIQDFYEFICQIGQNIYFVFLAQINFSIDWVFFAHLICTLRSDLKGTLTDRNFVDNFLKVVIYLALVPNI